MRNPGYLPGNVLDRRLKFRKQPEGTGVAREKVTLAPYAIGRGALEYIGRHAKERFFLYLALNQPHNNGEFGRVFGDGGYEVPSYGVYTNRDWPRAEKGFAANIRIIDDIVGNVLLKLREAGVAEDTVVMFSSDNGSCHGSGHDYQFFRSSGSLRGYKRDLYEGGIRVPFLARWPGRIAAGATSNHISAMWDMLPTFCDLAGAEIPGGIDGISMAPALLGKGAQQQHEHLYWEFAEQGGKQAVRAGKWKAVRLNTRKLGETAPIELYDLQKDPGETRDVAGAFPDVRDRMVRLLRESRTPHPVVKLFEEQ
jgi:arylsulfatase A-like enzyme